MPYKKLEARRLTNIPGPRSKKPPIRRQNAELVRQIAKEDELLQTLRADADVRYKHLRGLGVQIEPLSIWNNPDSTSMYPELSGTDLQEWNKLSEWMKLQMGFIVGLEFGSASFTANIHIDLINRWLAEGMSVPHLIQKRMKRELDKKGMGDLAYCYIIEGRTKGNKSRTNLHLHGYLLSDDPMMRTRFKTAVERALLSGDLRKRSPRVRMTIGPSYDLNNDDRGTGKWPAYMAKNVRRWDNRVAGRSVYMSRTLTQTAQAFWSLLREEPIT